MHSQRIEGRSTSSSKLQSADGGGSKPSETKGSSGTGRAASQRDAFVSAKPNRQGPELAPSGRGAPTTRVAMLKVDDGGGGGRTSPGQRAYDIARSALGRNTNELNNANDTELGRRMIDHVDPNNNCANFVSAVLESAGQLDPKQHDVSVKGLMRNLQADPRWKPVEGGLENAQVGDVIAIQVPDTSGKIHDHVVIYGGKNDDGQPLYLSSANRNADGTQKVVEEVYPWQHEIASIMRFNG